MLLFGLRDIFDSLVVAEMFNALFEEMFRSEVGFGLGRIIDSALPIGTTSEGPRGF